MQHTRTKALHLCQHIKISVSLLGNFLVPKILCQPLRDFENGHSIGEPSRSPMLSMLGTYARRPATGYESTHFGQCTAADYLRPALGEFKWNRLVRNGEYNNRRAHCDWLTGFALHGPYANQRDQTTRRIRIRILTAQRSCPEGLRATNVAHTNPDRAVEPQGARAICHSNG